MEPQLIEHEHEPNKGSSSLCRQSSTRWTPTTDQIRILKELYYNNGIRSPTAEQIQRISAKLRQYGKIEGKNVFYWFQNHKARERQKKRFTAPPDHHHQFVVGSNIPTANVVGCYRPNPNHVSPSVPVYKFSNYSNNGVVGASSSSGMLNAAGSNMCNYGYGSVAMEKSFRECSITPTGGNVNGTGGPMGQNISWIGVNEYSNNHYSTYPNFHHDDKRNYTINLEYQTLDEDEHAIETLPLFPMHGDDGMIRQQTHDYLSGSGGGWYKNDAVKQPGYSPRASLELTLNSCFANFNN